MSTSVVRRYAEDLDISGVIWAHTDKTHTQHTHLHTHEHTQTHTLSQTHTHTHSDLHVWLYEQKKKSNMGRGMNIWVALSYIPHMTGVVILYSRTTFCVFNKIQAKGEGKNAEENVSWTIKPEEMQTTKPKEFVDFKGIKYDMNTKTVRIRCQMPYIIS